MRKDEGGARRLYIDIDLPCPTIMAGGVGSVNCSQYELVDMRVFRDKRNGFGQELDVTNAPSGTYAQQWERLGNSVPPVMMYHIAMAVREQILDRIWVDMTGQAPVLVERDGTPN